LTNATRVPSSLIARIAVGCALALLAPAAGIAQAPDDVAIGAIRWDAWFDGAPDQAVLEQSEWRRRAPFFARWDEGGKLRLDGDKEHVLHAEVAYAKAIGIDYFIFGYYPDTGSWGRDPDFSLKLNRALLSYLRLPDRSGVKFALSLNQLFPMTDVEEMAGAVATFAAHSDYMTTSQGALPLFILAHDGLDWSRFFGSDDNARTAVQAAGPKAGYTREDTASRGPLPVREGVVRPVELVIAVVDTSLHGRARGGVARREVQLPRQPAGVARVRQQPRHQHLIRGKLHRWFAFPHAAP
jgi:hypothetical protein